MLIDFESARFSDAMQHACHDCSTDADLHVDLRMSSIPNATKTDKQKRTEPWSFADKARRVAMDVSSTFHVVPTLAPVNFQGVEFGACFHV